jgi:hypothetical protein
LVIWQRTVTAGAVCCVLCAFAAAPAAEQLIDGTPVPVRLAQAISSETTRPGEHVEFVVTDDVIVGGTIVIRRGVSVGGVLVDARAARWGFLHQHPRLTFRFSQVVASDGQPIFLRVAPGRLERDRAQVAYDAKHRELLWGGEDARYFAYVSGSYDVGR